MSLTKFHIRATFSRRNRSTSHKEDDVIVNPAEPVDYSKTETPSSYKCGKCGATGCKLWREYNTFLDHQTLFCLDCACKAQGKTRTPTEDGTKLYTGEVSHWYRTAQMEDGWWAGYDLAEGPPPEAVETKSERETSDQIGWLIPAVPTEANDTFWSYSSVPEAGCTWWYNLPYRPNTALDAGMPSMAS